MDDHSTVYFLPTQSGRYATVAITYFRDPKASESSTLTAESEAFAELFEQAWEDLNAELRDDTLAWDVISHDVAISGDYYYVSFVLRQLSNEISRL